jgi:hypothetical protein
MSQRTLEAQTRQRVKSKPKAPPHQGQGVATAELACPAEVADMLERMTLPERVRAYSTGSISRHELTIAAAREPERMPMCNGEFEWIALSLADLN